MLHVCVSEFITRVLEGVLYSMLEGVLDGVSWGVYNASKLLHPILINNTPKAPLCDN